MEPQIKFLIIFLTVFFCFVFIFTPLYLEMGGSFPSSISEYRCSRIYRNIAKQKQKRNTFKNIRYLKKLLGNERCTKELVGDIIYQRRYCYEDRSFPYDETIYLWGLTENRQLFSQKELKIIDRCNAEIESCLAQKKKTV